VGETDFKKFPSEEVSYAVNLKVLCPME
jgi:hypothetical protein